MNRFLDAELELFINETDHPSIKKGAPAFFLKTTSRVDLFEEPTLFLSENYVNAGSTPSRHTWAKAAYSLKSWFQYLQANECDWIAANEQYREAYRDDFLKSISPKTGGLYGTAGVRDSMTVIRQFHHFCAQHRLYHGDIGAGPATSEAARSPIDHDTIAHTRSAGSMMDKDHALPKVRPGIKIHPMLARDLQSLLNHVGPQAADRQGDQRTARDRLICDLAWAVGLRLNEISHLTTLQFLCLCPDPSAPFINMALTIYHGKGNKTRQVGIPAWLVMDAIAYIEGERKSALRACKSAPRNATTRLLVAHSGSKTAGKPISNGGIQKMFREACIALGLMTIKEKVDPSTGQISGARTPRHSVHDLRHTYAVLTYHAERANGNVEPWKKIQAQLGHKHLQTTIDTYLAHLEIFTAQPGLLDVRRMLGL